MEIIERIKESTFFHGILKLFSTNGCADNDLIILSDNNIVLIFNFSSLKVQPVFNV